MSAPQNPAERDSVGKALARTANPAHAASLLRRALVCLRTRGWQALWRETFYRLCLVFGKEPWQLRADVPLRKELRAQRHDALPRQPLISVVVAVTNIVPMLGPYLGAVPGAALLLFSGQPVHALEFLVIVLVVQQVDGNFIAPRILGSATGISGLWVLAAIVVGGGLFGIPGMVIGVPVLGVAANLAKAALPREPDGEKTKPGGET